MVSPHLASGPDRASPSARIDAPAAPEEPPASFTTIPLRALFYGILFEGIGALAVFLLLYLLRHLARP